ncbi:hypothetical protein ABZY10_18895 [Streptomyces sp. NPDC006539]|uniref:hypothetical protein n=1 Tax=Streptomyces TaxID=1883 RepID=UPI00339A82CB
MRANPADRSRSETVQFLNGKAKVKKGDRLVTFGSSKGKPLMSTGDVRGSRCARRSCGLFDGGRRAVQGLTSGLPSL